MTICHDLPRTGTHDVGEMDNEEKWEALGTLLRRQRVVVLGIRSRAEFARERDVSDSVIRDLESGRRNNYDIDTLLSLETWYGLTPEELRGALGDIYPIHEIAIRHDIATVQSARTDPEQTVEELRESVAKMAAILDTLRDELPKWAAKQQGK